MNRLSRMMNDTFQPKMAVIVYESYNNEGVYLERRDISKGKMGSGKPLSVKCVSDLMKTITIDVDKEDYRIHGTIPSNLMYVDFSPSFTKMVWYRPPEKRKMYFSKSLGIEDGEMNVPGLLYVVKGKQMYVYAFKGNKPKGKLYRAPFMNVSDTGVCLGNSKVSKPRESTYQFIIEYWEQMFWRSEFSHILGENPIKGNLATLTKELIQSGEKFPTDVLLPSNANLKDILR